MKFSRIAHKGFTLIELIITIVIIGILAAVAIPKFQDMTGEADQSVVSGVAAALASGTSVNFAKRKAGTGGTAVTGATCAAALTQAVVSAVADVPAVGGGVGELAFSGGTAIAADGVPVTCTVTMKGKTATFQAYGA